MTSFFLTIDYQGTVASKSLNFKKRYEPFVTLDDSNNYIIENLEMYCFIKPDDIIIKTHYSLSPS